MKMPFGKHHGIQLQDIPDDYLWWLKTIDLRPALRAALEHEINRRDAKRLDKENEDRIQFTLSEVAAEAREIVESGYRTVSMKCHPDVGGDHEKMKRVNAAAEKLREALA